MGSIMRAGKILLLVVFAAGCGDHGEELYVMDQRYEHDAEYGGGPFTGCTLAVYDDGGVGEGTLAGGPPGLQGDFVIEDFTEGKGLEVTVRSGEEILATRNYDVAFVRSGEVDTFQVTTHAGRVFDLAYWGGPRCDTSRQVLGLPEASRDSVDEE